MKNMETMLNSLEEKLGDQIAYELTHDVRPNERAFGIFLVFFNLFCVVFYGLHQSRSTGFFTNQFGPTEQVMLYGGFITWIITASLESVFKQKRISRLFDLYGGMEFLCISTIWLVIVFPFNFAYFSRVLPTSLQFSIGWITDGVAKFFLVFYTIFIIGGMIFSFILRGLLMRARKRLHSKNQNEKN